MKYRTVHVLHGNWTTLNILWGYADAGSIPDGVIGILFIDIILPTAL